MCVSSILLQLEKHPELNVHFKDLLKNTERLLNQKRADKNKLYSLHVPEVECIAKGKANKKYEFGVKTSMATTHKSKFVVGIKALPGNPYDGHTLVEALDQIAGSGQVTVILIWDIAAYVPRLVRGIQIKHKSLLIHYHA